LIITIKSFLFANRRNISDIKTDYLAILARKLKPYIETLKAS